MWDSQSIVSLKETKSFLEFMCISPFLTSRFRFIYYVSLLTVYEILFCSSYYFKYFRSGQVHNHLQKLDTVFFTKMMTWVLIGRSLSFGIILSLCSRSAQRQLLERMAALDARVRSQLMVDLSFRQLNTEFVACGIAFIIYDYGFYIFDAFYHARELASLIYQLCVTIGANFFHIYALYTVYWARAFANRAEHIIDALKVAISQRYISKNSLTIIMELIKLLFDVRESIQSAFGPTLCMIVMGNSFLIAISMFLLFHYFERSGESIEFWTRYSLWTLFLWLELFYIVVHFSRIGDVVSDF